MLDSIGGVKARIDAALESTLWGVIAASAAGAGALFLLIASFIWLTARYGSLVACLALGAIFVLAAVTAAIAFALSRRAPHRPIRDAADPAQGGLAYLLAAAAGGRQAAAEGVREVAATLSADLKKTIHRRPLTTLGLALCAGFIFGARRRR